MVTCKVWTVNPNIKSQRVKLKQNFEKSRSVYTWKRPGSNGALYRNLNFIVKSVKTNSNSLEN